jgi:hypothetical protein
MHPFSFLSIWCLGERPFAIDQSGGQALQGTILLSCHTV